MRKILKIGIVFLSILALLGWNNMAYASIVLIDSYSESNQDNSITLGLDYSGTTEVSQTFTASQTAKITSVKFYLAKTDGSPNTNAYARLFNYTGTYNYDATPTGSPLAVSDAVSMGTLSSSFQLVEFNFTGANQYQMSSGSKYAIEIYYPDGGGINYFAVGNDISSPTASGVESYYDGSWNPSYGNWDTIFYVYGDNAGSSPVIISQPTQFTLFGDW